MIRVLNLFVFFGIFTSAAVGCTFKKFKNSSEDSLVAPTYASLQTKVFSPKCVSCHMENGNAPHGVICTNYEHLMSGAVFPPLIIPGSPERSSLYVAVSSGGMPKDSSRLSKNEIDAIYTWIKNGAKQNENVQPEPSPTPGGEPGCSAGEPGCDDPSSPFPSSAEPCDLIAYPNEPGFSKCK